MNIGPSRPFFSAEEILRDEGSCDRAALGQPSSTTPKATDYGLAKSCLPRSSVKTGFNGSAPPQTNKKRQRYEASRFIAYSPERPVAIRYRRNRTAGGGMSRSPHAQRRDVRSSTPSSRAAPACVRSRASRASRYSSGVICLWPSQPTARCSCRPAACYRPIRARCRKCRRGAFQPR